MVTPDTPNNLSAASVVNPATFLGCKMALDFAEADVDVVVCGVPYDQSTTGRPGARFGPACIRSASANLAWELRRWPWDFSVFDILGIADCGDFPIDSAAGEGMPSQVQSHASRILAQDKTMLTFGGDHYISLPLLREHAKKWGPLALLQFDAHTDTEREPDQSNHGTVFSEAQQEGLIDPRRSVQIGIRSEYLKDRHRFRVLDADWIMDHSAADIISAIKQAVGNQPVYVTFDIDCLDPAYAPGTGTPVVGGLSTALALRVIRGLVGLKLIGMDIVEVSPPYDHAEITSLAAATIGLEFLYVLAAGMKERII